MIPDPLDELEALEARRRHPAGRLAPVERDPQTGRAVPQYIPAVTAPTKREEAVLAVVWGAVAGIGIWVFCTYLLGGAG